MILRNQDKILNERWMFWNRKYEIEILPKLIYKQKNNHFEIYLIKRRKKNEL